MIKSYEYKLSDDFIENDIISKNIKNNKNEIYKNIINFHNQKVNNGVFAEILTSLLLDANELNFYYKNHPHVDLLSNLEISGIVEKDELISVKSTIDRYSTINKSTINKIIGDTKSITLYSVFSYILYKNNINDLTAKKKLFEYFKKIFENKEVQQEKLNFYYISVINTILYHELIIKNQSNLNKDLDRIIECLEDNHLDYIDDFYSIYEKELFKKLEEINNKISICFIFPIEEENNNIGIRIRKKKSIPFSKYWRSLLDIYSISSKFYFNSPDVIKKAIKKRYLSGSKIDELFGEDWIDIKVLVGEFKFEYINKSYNFVKRGHIITKLRHADFGDENENVDKFFINAIDKLQENPKLIVNFNEFIERI